MSAIDMDKLLNELAEWGIQLGKAVIVFVIGRLIASLILRFVVRLLKRSGMDDMLIRFVNSIGKAFLTVIVVIVALSVLGVDTTSLIAMLGAAGLAVGLALQDSLRNFAAGVLLLVFRPFTKGDFVEAGGTEGVVQSISLFSTEMLTWDNRKVIVPNGNIWGSVITNNTAEDLRRVDMVFGISYGDDLREARRIIEQVLGGDDRVLKDPPPNVLVAELGDSSVNFYVQPWVKAEDFWRAKCGLTEKIKLAFDESGVSIPFPQMDVHFNRAGDIPA